MTVYVIEAEVEVEKEEGVEAEIETEKGEEVEAETEEEAEVETGRREAEVGREDVGAGVKTRKEDTEAEVEVKKVNGEAAEMKLRKLQTKSLTKMKLNSFECIMEKFRISQPLDVLFN